MASGDSSFFNTRIEPLMEDTSFVLDLALVPRPSLSQVAVVSLGI